MASQIPDIDTTTRTVHVGNLDMNCSEDIVKAFFEMHCGPVIRANLVGQPDGTQAVRYGFVEFATPEGVPKAFALSGALLGLHAIKVSQARGQILKSANHTFAPSVDPVIVASNTHAYASGLQAENLRYQQWLASRHAAKEKGEESSDSDERRRKRRRRRGRSSSSDSGSRGRKRRRSRSRDRSRGRERRSRRSRDRTDDRDRGRSRDCDRHKGREKDRDNSKDKERQKEKENEQGHSRERARERSGDRDRHEKYGSKDTPANGSDKKPSRSKS